VGFRARPVLGTLPAMSGVGGYRYGKKADLPLEEAREMLKDLPWFNDLSFNEQDAQ
jgi:hypothetical protein